MTSQRRVIDAFLAGRSAKASNLHSDGTSLWSYGWWELARWHNGVVVVRNGGGYSQSTKCQMSKLWLPLRMSGVEWFYSPLTPVRSGTMGEFI